MSRALTPLIKPAVIGSVSKWYVPIKMVRNYLHINGQEKQLFHTYEQAKKPEE
jgi:hypothetical protein